MGRDIFFSDEFMDDLAERVARKLATRFYRNGFFAEKAPRKRSIIYTEDDDINYGCGSTNHRRYESSGGCGSGSSYQPNGGC